MLLLFEFNQNKLTNKYIKNNIYFLLNYNLSKFTIEGKTNLCLLSLTIGV